MTEQEKIEFKKRLDLLVENKLDEMRKLLDSGVNVNEKDESGQTLLHFISSMGLLNSAKFLLENGADENIKDNAGKTPLDYAQNEEIKTLFHTSKTSSKSEINPLHEAVKKGDIEKVKSLLDSGMDANTQDEDGLAPLHEANENRDKEIVALLLEAGANIDIEDNDGYTPLHYACANGAKEIVALLLEAGANVNAKNKNGRSPLYFVNNKEIAQILLDKGVDFRSKDKDGNTPLVFAYANEAKEVIDLLTEKEIQKRAQQEDLSQESSPVPPSQNSGQKTSPAQEKEVPLPVSSQDTPAVIKEGEKESPSTEPEKGSGKGYGKNDTSVWTYLQRKKIEDSEKGKHIPLIEHIEYLEKKEVRLLHVSFASGASVDDFGKDMTYYPSVSDTLDEYIAIASAVRLRGDKSVSLEGSPEFKRKMYLACQIVGLKTPDYTPYNEAEKATAKGQHDAKEFQNYRFHVFGEPTAEQIKALQDKLKQEQMDREAAQKEKEEEGKTKTTNASNPEASKESGSSENPQKEEEPRVEPEVEPETEPEPKPEAKPAIEPVSEKESSQTLQENPQEETKKPLNEQLQEKEHPSKSSEKSEEQETEQEEAEQEKGTLENSSEPEDMFAPIKRQKETWGNDYRPLKKEIDAKLRKKATEDLLNLPLYYRKNDLNLMFSKDVNGYNQYIKQYGDEDPNHYYEPGSAYRSIIETALAKYEDEYLKEEIEAEACKKGATLITLNGKKYVLSLLSSKMDKPFVDSIKAAYNAIWRFRYIQKVSQEKTQLHQKAFEKYAAEFDPEKMHQFDKYFFLTNTKNKKNTSYRQYITFVHEDKNGKLKLDKVDLVFMKSCLEKV
ncbi:MAG: ankyrin repeat domain-containing protein, partial [Alphaproteobacteria bacterium]|nr:ankyrin repeat domain-containing protein [Alphaproteobacteria bacterium]